MFDVEMRPALPFLTDLGSKIKEQENLYQAVEVLTEALGAEAGYHLETLICRLRCSVRREAAPYSHLDIGLLKSLMPACEDRMDANRLQGIIDSMEANV